MLPNALISSTDIFMVTIICLWPHGCTATTCAMSTLPQDLDSAAVGVLKKARGAPSLLNFFVQHLYPWAHFPDPNFLVPPLNFGIYFHPVISLRKLVKSRVFGLKLHSESMTEPRLHLSLSTFTAPFQGFVFDWIMFLHCCPPHKSILPCFKIARSALRL